MDTNYSATETTELLNPTSGNFTAAASMADPRGDFTATLLSGGKVLVADGYNHFIDAGGVTYFRAFSARKTLCCGGWKAHGIHLTQALLLTVCELYPHELARVVFGFHRSRAAPSAAGVKRSSASGRKLRRTSRVHSSAAGLKAGVRGRRSCGGPRT